MSTGILESKGNEQTPAQLMGIYLQSRRELGGDTLENTARRLGMESDELTNYEQGVSPLPPPYTITKWANTLEYNAAEVVDILGKADYLPKTGSLIDLERPVLMGALRELFYPSGNTQTHRSFLRFLHIGVACFLSDARKKIH